MDSDLDRLCRLAAAATAADGVVAVTLLHERHWFAALPLLLLLGLLRAVAEEVVET